MTVKLWKATELRSRKKHYMVMAGLWLYTLAPFATGGVFLYLIGEVPLVLQVLILVWLILVVFFTPSLPELFTSYDKYVEEWIRDNEPNGVHVEEPEAR